MNTEEITALSSAVIALAALFVALRADARAKKLALVQMFLALRSRFLEVYRELPPPAQDAASYSDDDRAAVLAYWHHTFDEWYITNVLSHSLMNKLWDAYYAPAILSGLRHDGYRQILFELIDSGEGIGEYQAGFGEAVKRLWESRGSDARP